MSVLAFDELVAKAGGKRIRHFGVKGMKWGVSRRRGTSSSSSSSSSDKSDKAEVSEDFLKARVARSKPPASLSNKDMQDLITRMELEQRYVRLTSTPPPVSAPTRKAKAAKFITDLMVDIGRQEISRVARGQASLKVEEGLTRRGKVDLAERIKPKKKK